MTDSNSSSTDSPEVVYEVGDPETEEGQEKLRTSFADWLTRIDPVAKKLVLDSGLNPWDKYALVDRPHRAMYYRVAAFGFCPNKNHVHLTLTGFSHLGKPICQVEPVSPDRLIPYPYSADHPPPPEVVRIEEEVMRRIDMLNAILPDGSIIDAVFGGPGDETAAEDLLMGYDDRRGKDKGH